MYANWATASVTSGGTGNLTVAAVAGVPTPYQTLGTKYFSYSLESAAGQPIEAGIGHMSDGTTFVRDRVLQTYDGTNIVLLSPGAQNIPSNSVLICTPLAHTLPELPTTIDSANTTGRFLGTSDRPGPSATLSLTALRLYYAPFKLDFGVTISSLACNVTAAGVAGTQALMGLRTFTPSGGIGARLDGVAAFAVDTTGIKNQALSGGSIQLTPGWYIAEIVAAAAVTVTGYLATTYVGTTPWGFAGGTFNAINFRYEALGSLALPASPGSLSNITAGGSVMPAVLLGVT